MKAISTRKVLVPQRSSPRRKCSYQLNMAVKPREKTDNAASGVIDPKKLAQYLQMFQHPDIYLPTPAAVVDLCKDIAIWLGGVLTDDKSERLMNEVNICVRSFLATTSPKIRKEIVLGIRNLIMPMITANAGAPTHGVFVLLNVLQGEASEWMTQEGEPHTTNLKAIMRCLYRWLYTYECIPMYGDIVMMFIKKLEDKERWQVLEEVSMEEMTPLFNGLARQRNIRENIAPVVFHIFGSMRRDPMVLEKIAPHVHYVLENLAWDSSHSSRQILQTVVDITTAMVNELEPSQKEKYAALISTLDTHMPSNSCRYVQLGQWRDGCGAATVRHLTYRNGLRNVGNMCYFNSVMQALLLNRIFSRHALSRAYNTPVWAAISKMFARMLYAQGPSLECTEFYRVLKPHEFTEGHQHDCSEFLIHLMDSLSAVEIQMKANGNVKPALEAQASPNEATQGSSTAAENTEQPREVKIDMPFDAPETSKSASSSGATKRSADDNRNNILVKRRCFRTEAETFIQATFGGTSFTSITCLLCGANSVKHDTFREIQLAIPDKTDVVKDEYTVQFLLNYYCKAEILTGDNAYHCSVCNQLTDAEKTIHMNKPPKYLLVVLKRFNYNPTTQTHTKLMHKVVMNKILCVPVVNTNSEFSTYNLYATVIHAGTHVDMGHYYTLAKDSTHGWFRYNDDVVESVDEKELVRLNHAMETPYLLFYRRTDVEEQRHIDISELPEAVVASVRTYDKQQASRHRHGTRSSTGHATVRPIYT